MQTDRRDPGRKTASLRALGKYGTLVGSLLVLSLFLIGWSGWEFGHSLFAHLCHQKSERCFMVGPSSLAVCSRCLGIYIGITGGCALFWLRANSVLDFRNWAGAILAGGVLVNLLDVGFEWVGFYENAIWTRSFLGLLLGASLSLFIFSQSSHSVDRKEETVGSMRLPESG